MRHRRAICAPYRIAPDGSALAAGDASTLLYKPAGGEFRRISFGGADTANITDVSMPTSHTAWLANTLGQVYRGTRTDGEWEFDVENRTPDGKLLSFAADGTLLKLRAIEVDREGEGYAVGDRGLVLERRRDGWQRLKTGFQDTFRSVALAPHGRGSGALIGGDAGLILTLEDGEFRVAREADIFDPLNWGEGSSRAANVLGVAIVPGLAKGEAEAWAVQQPPQSGRPGSVFHYTSDSDQPLMRPGGRLEPVPDAPAPREGEISFAAFGRSDCHTSVPKCPEGHARNLFNEVVSRRVVREVVNRAEQPGGPAFAVFTGDAGRAAGKEEGASVNTPLDKSLVHRRWIEQVADRFSDSGLPLYGAVGFNDLDRTAACTSPITCPVDSKSQAAGRGLTWGWRKAMADMPAPWGTGREADAGGVHFDAVERTGTGRPDRRAGAHSLRRRRLRRPLRRAADIPRQLARHARVVRPWPEPDRGAADVARGHAGQHAPGSAGDRRDEHADVLVSGRRSDPLGRRHAPGGDDSDAS